MMFVWWACQVTHADIVWEQRAEKFIMIFFSFELQILNPKRLYYSMWVLFEVLVNIFKWKIKLFNCLTYYILFNFISFQTHLYSYCYLVCVEKLLFLLLFLNPKFTLCIFTCILIPWQNLSWTSGRNSLVSFLRWSIFGKINNKATHVVDCRWFKLSGKYNNDLVMVRW